MEVLCSTGALIGRPNGRNPRLLGDFVKQLTGDGLEMMMYSTWYENVEEVTDYVRSLGLHIPVFHCQKTVGEEASKGDFALAESQVEINAKMAEALGATKMVFHLWNGQISDFFIDNNLKADLHLIPYAGRIDWEAVRAALNGIGYSGVVSLEVNMHPQIPEGMWETVRLWMRDAANRIAGN